MKYRDFNIEFIYPPIPLRSMDYSWSHEDYDGPEDNRIGLASSIEECKAAIDEWYKEQSWDQDLIDLAEKLGYEEIRWDSENNCYSGYGSSNYYDRSRDDSGGFLVANCLNELDELFSKNLERVK